MGLSECPLTVREKEQERSANFATSLVKRKLNFLSKNAKGVCDELKKSIDSEATPLRVERQIKRLNDYESIGELLADVEQDDLIKEVLEGGESLFVTCVVAHMLHP